MAAPSILQQVNMVTIDKTFSEIKQYLKLTPLLIFVLKEMKQFQQQLPHDPNIISHSRLFL